MNHSQDVPTAIEVGSLPKYSIVIPVYNVEQHLSECLDSVYGQALQDFEVVLVNDGSTDASLKICEDYRKLHPTNTRIISQQNSGLLSARRVGFKEARGEYIWPVDSDDVVRADALSLIDEAVRCYGVDMVFFECTFQPDFSSFRWTTHFVESTYFPAERKAEVLYAYCMGRMNPLVLKVAKRECFNPDHDYSEYGRLNFAEDQLQSLEVLDRAESFAYIRELLYFYRQNGASITGKYQPGDYAEYARVKCVQVDYASKWEAEYLVDGLVDLCLAGYLRSTFYDFRKATTHKTYKEQLEEIRNQKLYDSALRLLPEVRVDLRLFHRWVNASAYKRAYALAIVSRSVMLIRRTRLHSLKKSAENVET